MEIAREKGITEEEYKRMTIKHKGPKVAADVTTAWKPEPSGPVPRTTTGELFHRICKIDKTSVSILFQFIIFYFIFFLVCCFLIQTRSLKISVNRFRFFLSH